MGWKGLGQLVDFNTTITAYGILWVQTQLHDSRSASLQNIQGIIKEKPNYKKN